MAATTSSYFEQFKTDLMSWGTRKAAEAQDGLSQLAQSMSDNLEWANGRVLEETGVDVGAGLQRAAGTAMDTLTWFDDQAGGQISAKLNQAVEGLKSLTTGQVTPFEAVEIIVNSVSSLQSVKDLKETANKTAKRIPDEEYKEQIRKHLYKSLFDTERPEESQNNWAMLKDAAIESFCIEGAYQIAAFVLNEQVGKDFLEFLGFDKSLVGGLAAGLTSIMFALKNEHITDKSQSTTDMVLSEVTRAKADQILNDDLKMLHANLGVLFDKPQVQEYIQELLLQKYNSGLLGDTRSKINAGLNMLSMVASVANVLYYGGPKLLFLSVGLGLLAAPLNSQFMDEVISKDAATTEMNSAHANEVVAVLGEIQEHAKNGELGKALTKFQQNLGQIMALKKSKLDNERYARMFRQFATFMSLIIGCAYGGRSPFRLANAMSNVITLIPKYTRDLLIDERFMAVGKKFDWMQHEVIDNFKSFNAEEELKVQYQENAEEDVVKLNCSVWGVGNAGSRQGRTMSKYVRDVQGDENNLLFTTSDGSGNTEITLDQYGRYILSGPSGSGKSRLIDIILRTNMFAKGNVQLPCGPGDIHNINQEITFPNDQSLAEYLGLDIENGDAYTARITQLLRAHYGLAEDAELTAEHLGNSTPIQRFRELREDGSIAQDPAQEPFEVLLRNYFNLAEGTDLTPVLQGRTPMQRFIELAREEMGLQDVISQSNLSNPNQSWASTFSGGQLCRLAILQAIIRNPRILIMDETFNQLNDQVKKGVMGFIDKCLRKTLILYVDHHINKEFGFTNTKALIVNKEEKTISVGTKEKARKLAEQQGTLMAKIRKIRNNMSVLTSLLKGPTEPTNPVDPQLEVPEQIVQITGNDPDVHKEPQERLYENYKQLLLRHKGPELTSRILAEPFMYACENLQFFKERLLNDEELLQHIGNDIHFQGAIGMYRYRLQFNDPTIRERKDIYRGGKLQPEFMERAITLMNEVQTALNPPQELQEMGNMPEAQAGIMQSLWDSFQQHVVEPGMQLYGAAQARFAGGQQQGVVVGNA